ncbi:hypothetical protein ACMYR3_13045 [Ampullimonas aquatilis]|uniref:hypothetical protein n=1 Tax=Ampullimonas aquatilis TaxID=1341549 RepID=UPI003C772886
MFSLLKILPVAIATELASLGLLFLRSHQTSYLLAYFLLHGIASILLAVVLSPFMPKPYHRPRRWLILYLFAINFFIPIAGFIMMLAGFVISRLLPKLSGLKQYESIAVPEYNTHRDHEGTGFRSGQVRARLSNYSVPVDNRLQALLAVQDAPARATSGILRELLTDPMEDLRLLAYGLLDGKEKSITQKIMNEREALKTVHNRREAKQMHKRIAELYWELIYQNLVQGDMATFAAQEAFEHAELGLEQDPDDAGLWFLLGRIGLSRNDLLAADEALGFCELRGFPRERLLPYLSELRFRQRRFDDVRQLMREQAQYANSPALVPIQNYWAAA